jgi:chaperonin cofactor prefoldin
MAVSGAIGGGFWKLGRSIGRLEGKVEELDTRMHAYEKQLGGLDTRIDRLDKRINGFLDNFVKQERKKE